MKFLILVFCLASVYGREENDVWDQLRTVLPQDVSQKAEEVGLSHSKVFQESVIRKLHGQVVEETLAIQARQKILKEFIECSCPECPENEDESSKARQISFTDFLNPFNIVKVPHMIITRLFQGCQTELAVETVKLVRVSLLEVQLKAQKLAGLVSCNCPDSKRCKKILDPLIFSIVTGHNVTELEHVYWAKELEGVPHGMDRGLIDNFTNAAANIMSYFFHGSRPTKEEYASPPTQIFAPGVDPSEWTRRPLNSGCPTVQVNISPNSNASLDVNSTVPK